MTKTLRPRFIAADSKIASMKKPEDGNEVVYSGNILCLQFTYPLTRNAFRTLRSHRKTGGFTRRQLVSAVRRAYHEIYRRPSYFGIWGHSIRDLFFDGLQRIGKTSNLYGVEISS